VKTKDKESDVKKEISKVNIEVSNKFNPAMNQKKTFIQSVVEKPIFKLNKIEPREVSMDII